VVSLAALSAVSWLSYRNTKELIAANQRLGQVHKLIEDLAALHVLLDDAESSCRDYALSGRAESLKPYEAALAQLDTSMQVLGRDLAADPNHSRQLQELEPVIKARLEAMKELVQASATSGLDAAVKSLQSDRGKRLTDEIRQRILIVQTEECNDLRERESRERARGTILAVGVTCLLGVVLLLTASLVIVRLNRQSKQASSNTILPTDMRVTRTGATSRGFFPRPCRPDAWF